MASRNPRPGASPSYAVSAEIDEDAVERICHTENFDVDEFIVIRRGSTIPIQLKSRSTLNVESAVLVYDDEGDSVKEVIAPVERLNFGVHGATIAEVSET